MAQRVLRDIDRATKAEAVDEDMPTALERKKLADAIDGLAAEGYADAVYAASAELLELGWKNARALLGIEAGFDVVPQHALDVIRQRAGDLQFLVEERERDTLRSILDNGLAEGASTERIASRIRDAFAAGYHRLNAAGEVVLISPTDAWSETVARTELATASTDGALSLYREAGLKTVRWMCADPCDICAPNDDEVFALDDIPEGGPPLHPNCAPAGTMIATERGLRPIESIAVGDRVLTHRQRLREVRALSRTDISEDLFELRVGSYVLRVTGNHPVRTRDGWTPASALQPGDEIATVDTEAYLALSGQSNQVPSECVKCGRLRLVLGSLALAPGVPSAAVNLDALGESEHRLSGEMTGVQRTNLVVSEDATTNAGGNHGGGRLPNHIVIVPLSDVRRLDFRGRVFNFAVADDESYVADGVVVHNCACAIVPADDNLGDFRGTEDEREAATHGNG